jgi:hypothetical protein
MRQLLSIVGLGALGAWVGIAGCKPGPANNNTDSGSSDANVTLNQPIITVSGKAEVYPVWTAWLADAGQPLPSLDGLTLTVDEPLKVATGDPSGTFGTVILDAGGQFSVPNVDTSQIVLGLAVGLRDDADAGLDAGPFPDGGCCVLEKRVVSAGTAIYDVALASGNTPQGDITNAVGFAIPAGFHDQLTRAITPAKILTVTTGSQSTLIGAGFILGQIVDANGVPLAGATVVPTSVDPTQFFYPTDDLRSTQAATGSTGLFVFVHNGGPVATFTFTIANHAEYLKRNAGAAAGHGLVLVVYPGAQP